MESLESTLTALADPTRRRILGRLAQGTATVTELVQNFELTQPTISSHLKVLERSGLISRYRVGNTRPCKLEPKGLTILTHWLEDLRTVYEQNYARLDRVLEDMKRANETGEK